MAKQIAVAGKGGTGKTSFCALLIRYLIEKGKTPILAVDADANANLNEVLGMEITSATVSELIENTKDPEKLPAKMLQETYIEYKLNDSLSEGKDVDLLVMGGPQGPGCYCFPNNILRKYLGNLETGYQYIVVDNEAGLEHISRRTTQNVEHLFVISDSSVRSVRSAGRVKKLLEGIKTPVRHVHLIITKTDEHGIEQLAGEIEKTGLDYAGFIPHDPLITEFDRTDKPVIGLPEASVAVHSVYSILDKIGI